MLAMPKDNIEMRKKLLFFNIVSLVAIYFLILPNVITNNSTPVIEMLGTTINANILIPILIIALASDAYQFHNILGQIFPIRETIDIEYIIKPLAGSLGITFETKTLLKLKNKNTRDDLMGKIFYRYADSLNPLISPFRIACAFEGNFWMWYSLDNFVFYFLASIFYPIISWLVKGIKFASITELWLFIIAIVCLINFFHFFRKVVKLNASKEVKEIVSNETRKNDIKGVLEDIIKITNS